MVVLVSQELLRPSTCSIEELTKEDQLLNVQAPDSEETGLVSEYAYALKCAFAETFNVELYEAKFKEVLTRSNSPAEEITSATLGLSTT